MCSSSNPVIILLKRKLFDSSITGWRASTCINAYEAEKCATYTGRVGFYPIDCLAWHIIKTEEDLRIAEVLLGDRGRKAEGRGQRTVDTQVEHPKGTRFNRARRSEGRGQ